jgi:hypothetical protein
MGLLVYTGLHRRSLLLEVKVVTIIQRALHHGGVRAGSVATGSNGATARIDATVAAESPTPEITTTDSAKMPFLTRCSGPGAVVKATSATMQGCMEGLRLVPCREL